MTDRELMQQALEAMEWVNTSPWLEDCYHAFDKEVTALRERLAQPQMQPCAGRNCGSTNPNLHSAECFEDYEKATGMNQWQGLTDEEIQDLSHLYQKIDASNSPWFDRWGFAKSIEAKLREKNHG